MENLQKFLKITRSSIYNYILLKIYEALVYPYLVNLFECKLSICVVSLGVQLLISYNHRKKPVLYILLECT